MPHEDIYPVGAPSWVETLQPDLDTAIEFYGALFGWRFEEAPGTSGDRDLLLAHVNGQPAASIRQAPEGVPPSWLMHVPVRDLELALAAVEGAGGSLLIPPSDWGVDGRVSIVADSTGVPFCVREGDGSTGAPPSGTTGTPGSWAMASLHSSDVDAAQEFYSQTFGWTLRSVPDAQFSQWMLADRVIGLLVASGDTPQHWSLNFRVADADAAARTAVRSGGTVVLDPFDTDEHRNTVIADRAGAVIACSAPRITTDHLGEDQ